MPDDLSVVGYDDIEIAEYLDLTTVRQQLFESGRLGAELLIREIGSRSPVPPSIVLPPKIVVRGTTAPAEGGLSPAPIVLCPIHDHDQEEDVVFHSRALRARSWRTAFATSALLAGVMVAPVSAQSPAPAASGGALVSPNCGTEPVQLLAYFETGFDLPTRSSARSSPSSSRTSPGISVRTSSRT